MSEAIMSFIKNPYPTMGYMHVTLMSIVLLFPLQGGVQLLVGGMADGGNFLFGNCLQNGALLVVHVGAVGIAALAEVGGELAEGVRQILQLEEIEPLKVQEGEARGVGDVAAFRAGQVEQLGMAGGVLTPTDLFADVPRCEIQTGEDRIEQGGFACAGCARHGGDLPLQLGMGEVRKFLHALTCIAGQDEGTVADLFVEGGDLSRPLGGQLALAHDDDGLYVIEFQNVTSFSLGFFSHVSTSVFPPIA